jgi:hypothetical protein
MVILFNAFCLFCLFNFNFRGNVGSASLTPFTPFRIEDAQYATPSSLITAHKAERSSPYIM